MNKQPSTRWQQALQLTQAIDCKIGDALTLLSGGNYRGETIDYWQYEYTSRDDKDEAAHINYIKTHTL